MNLSAHRIAVDLSRRERRQATAPQRHRLAELAKQAGIEPPRVFWSCDASDAITRLESILREPMLEGFSASTSLPAVCWSGVGE